ncbi:GNAT family N-acetyltransferase [Streptomyces sp. NPDC005930]|uniref:GNAT family N-acetyltransferase n=1 Tax=Streptomyces sp. NPDC005930 TaxID=3364736 RepID=UPI00369D94C6
MQPREAVTADIPELIRLRAVALEGLGTDPGPADTPWRRIAHGWFEERINHRDDCVCLVVGSEPGGPLLACGMAWITYHLPSPRWPDGRRGYLDGIVTDVPARGRGHARRIVDALVGRLRTAGIHYVQLHASTAGKPVYEAAGFVTGRYPSMDLIAAPPAG